jgi:protein required for attachment to host cells
VSPRRRGADPGDPLPSVQSEEMAMRGASEWALIADGRRARFLEHEPPFGTWRERSDDAIEAEIPPSRELGADRPGRAQESAAAMRHAIEPKTDPHREAKRLFARQLAERLEAAAGKYERLLLVAPPTFLGDLRGELGGVARQRLRGTVDKDLTRATLAEIAAQLDAVPR